jgi:RNA polymerase sigma-70 factor (ECF subfamily)
MTFSRLSNIVEIRKDASILTDEKLVAEAKAGDANAFKELVKRYEPRVAAAVIGMLGKCQEAEDVGQETFIRFYNGLKNFRGESGVATYLTRIAINLSLNELKRRKRRSMLFWNTLEENYEIPDEKPKSEYSGEKEIVQKAIQKLDSKFRTVMVLRLMDGFSTEETAEILNIPVGTVLSRLARGQQKLKEELLPIFEEVE